ncbi:hypothetical protein Poli38472_011296 [Pythium oligandrum]|uniref:Protein kinase domain-containing protein n=1 Tax=Pythium oligandrum TaxID=41045 RepID=A0A8K1CS61_PYTOL|nr:hypothetical protein Poli38472_011296 [Pythium oligandrum]|eukprot:TMW67676.1 hypothetical protein Poli38472_011296 [Pythium oligandrum]
MFALVEGQTLLGRDGRYRFLSRIASGTFAVLLRAWDSVTDSTVAIKCIQDPAFNAIGEREAALLRELNTRDAMGNVAVVRVLDYFVEQSHCCLVVELLGDPVLDVERWGSWRQARVPFLSEHEQEPQHKLYALLRRQRRLHDGNTAPVAVEPTPVAQVDPLPLHRIRQMAVELCAALAFLHDQGVIHADLKPENVLNASSDGASSAGLKSVKLVDFGNCIEQQQIALYYNALEEEGMQGFDIQTLAYRAPEIATGLVIGPAMDMWSLGCVLVECATGSPLFASYSEDSTSMPGTTADLLEQIQWTLTGGKALSTVCPSYRTARYTTKDMIKKDSQSPPLRVRLKQSRPRDVAEGEWHQFEDFIERLLTIDPTPRLAAREAFLHPFVQAMFPFQLIFAPSLSSFPPISTFPAVAEDSTATTTTTTASIKTKRKRTEGARTTAKTLRFETKIAGQRRVGLKAALKMIPSALKDDAS